MGQNIDNHEYYLRQIHQLKRLQNVDDKIHEIRRVLENGPRELKDLQEQFDHVESRREHILDKISHLKDQEIRLGREMEEAATRLKKSKNKLMAASNEMEYQAGQREVANLEKLVQPHQDERIAISEELNSQNEALSEVDAQYAEIKDRLDACAAAVEKESTEASGHLADLDAERKSCCEDLSPAIFQRYEFIRNRLEHPVIVALSDSICPSCRIALPPQTYNDLLRGEHILSCPSCQRLIVAEQDYTADDPQPVAEPEEPEEQEEN